MILHPVLADLPGFPVCYQLIGVQGDIKIKVVIDHYLKCFAFDTFAGIGINGLALNFTFGPETVSVDSAGLQKLIKKLRSQFSVPLFRDVAQRIF